MIPSAYEPVTSTIDHGTTRDGIIQIRRRWRPTQSARAAVLVLHGIAEHGGRYEHVGRRLADAGFDVVACDHRGFGRSGGRRGHVDSWSQFTDDVEDQLAELRALGVPIVLFGHSMGGLMASRYAVDDRPQPDLLLLSAPALDAKIRAHLRLGAPIIGRLLPTLEIREDGDPSLLSRDERVGDVFYADPYRVPYPTARLGQELMRAMEVVSERLSEITMPTLVLHGGADGLVPASSSEILEPLPNVERRLYEELRHELFNEPEGPEIVDEVIVWIDEQLSSASA